MNHCVITDSAELSPAIGPLQVSIRMKFFLFAYAIMGSLPLAASYHIQLQHRLGHAPCATQSRYGEGIVMQAQEPQEKQIESQNEAEPRRDLAAESQNLPKNLAIFGVLVLVLLGSRGGDIISNGN